MRLAGAVVRTQVGSLIRSGHNPFSCQPAMEPPGLAAGTVFVDAPQFVVALPRAAGPPRPPGTSLLAHSG